MKLQSGELCPLCQQGHFLLATQDVELSYKGRSICLTHLELYQCSFCENNFYSKESERKMDKAFADLRRTQDGLLTSTELKELRAKINLSQEQLSLLLGMAPKTLARYESGTVIQSKATDILLRLLNDNPSNLGFLMNYYNSGLSNGMVDNISDIAG